MPFAFLETEMIRRREERDRELRRSEEYLRARGKREIVNLSGVIAGALTIAGANLFSGISSSAQIAGTLLGLAVLLFSGKRYLNSLLKE